MFFINVLNDPLWKVASLTSKRSVRNYLMIGISLDMCCKDICSAREWLALDSLNSEKTDHKPHYQEKKPQNDHIGFLNDSLLFRVTVGSSYKPCITVP